MPKAIVVLLILVFSSGCGFTEAKQNGAALADTYFEIAAKEDTAAVLDLYDDAFYSATPRQKWQDMYERIHAKLGKPNSHTLQNWNVNNFAGTAGSGQYVTLVYKVEYERASGVETIGVFIPSGSRQARIRGHNFNSDALVAQ